MVNFRWWISRIDVDNVKRSLEGFLSIVIVALMIQGIAFKIFGLSFHTKLIDNSYLASQVVLSSDHGHMDAIFYPQSSDFFLLVDLTAKRDTNVTQEMQKVVVEYAAKYELSKVASIPLVQVDIVEQSIISDLQSDRDLVRATAFILLSRMQQSPQTSHDILMLYAKLNSTLHESLDAGEGKFLKSSLKLGTSVSLRDVQLGRKKTPAEMSFTMVVTLVVGLAILTAFMTIVVLSQLFREWLDRRSAAGAHPPHLPYYGYAVPAAQQPPAAEQNLIRRVQRPTDWNAIAP
eukprot:gene30998-37462_t